MSASVTLLHPQETQAVVHPQETQAVLEAGSAITASVIPLKVDTPVVNRRGPYTKRTVKYRPQTRKEILEQLRAESFGRRHTTYSSYEDSLLIDLARAAANSTKRSITWRGIRFPLRNGVWLTVLDPETRKPLVSTQGGIV